MSKDSAEVKLKGDASDLDRTIDTEAAKIAKLSGKSAQVKITGDGSDLTHAAEIATAEAKAVGAQSPEVKIKGNNKNFMAAGLKSMGMARLIGSMDPTVVIKWKNDMFMNTAGLIMRTLKGIPSNKTIHYRTNARQVGTDHNFLSRSAMAAGSSMGRFWGLTTGHDGTKFTLLGKLAGAIFNVGYNAKNMASPMLGAATAVGELGEETALATTKAGAKGGLPGLALGIASAGASAFVAAAGFGFLLSLIMPILAILSIGVATIAAVGLGLGVMGAAGIAVGKDFALLANSERTVHNAQIKLNSAMKASKQEQKDLGPMTRNLAKLKDQETDANKRLSKAYDNLSGSRDPKNAKQVAAAEKELSAAQKHQDQIARKLDDTYKILQQKRTPQNAKKVAAAEKDLTGLQKAQDDSTRRLDRAYANLNKARDAGKIKGTTAAEKELNAAKENQEKATQRVKDQQEKLNKAQDPALTQRVKSAQKELANAQNDQALAIKKASDGSAEYRKNLQHLQDSVKKLGPAFEEAFNPAKVKMADLMARTVDWTVQLLPALGKAADKSLDQFDKGFSDGYDKGSTFKSLLDKLPPVMGDLGGVTKNTSSFFNTFMEIAMPYIKDFTQWLEDASERLASWADSKQGRKDIQEFLDLAVPLAKSLGNLFKMVGSRLMALAKEHGPFAIEMIDNMTKAVHFLFDILDLALDVAEKLVAAWKWIQEHANSRNEPGKPATTGNSTTPVGKAFGGDEMVSMARGGKIDGTKNLYRAATGLTALGAHFVEHSSYMNVGDNLVNYGEALSGGSREYAFPLDGGYRFITEQPGFDMNSYSLWKDLGDRKGYSSHNTAAPQAGPAPAIHMPSMPSTRGAGGAGGTGAIEHRISHMEAVLAHASAEVRDEVSEIPHRIRDSVNSNNAHSRQGRTSVLMGLTREARRKAFEEVF